MPGFDLSSLLYNDPYTSDMKRLQTSRGYGTPSRGSDMSLYLSQAREQDRQGGIAGGIQGIGSIISLLAYLKGQQGPAQFQNVQGQQAGRDFAADRSLNQAYAPQRQQAMQQEAQRRQQLQMLLQLLGGNVGQGSYGQYR